jgi:sugar phosphate isomerase/epimerase
MESPPGSAFFFHLPYPRLAADPSAHLGRGIGPEIYLSSDDVASFDPAVGRRLAGLLANAGLPCTFHAPFLDLNPGAYDEDIRRLSVDKYLAVLRIAAIFSPRTIVFHPGYDRWRYDGQVGHWLDKSLLTWREVLAHADEECPETRLLIENIFDEEPAAIVSLLDSLDHPRAGFCFDTGHFAIFSRVPWQDWLAVLGQRIVELHLHDNAGDADRHSPPGTGVFPFDPFFESLRDRVAGPLCMTIEAHSEPDLAESIRFLRPRFPGLLTSVPRETER